MSKKFTYLLCLLLAFTCEFSAAQQKDIVIEGNQTITETTIIHYLKINSKIDQFTVNKAIKNLYETGFFKEIKADIKDNKLYIYVSENPIAKSININGNNKIKSKDLKKLLLTKTGEFISDYKVARDKKTIIAAYKSNGFINCKVEVRVEKINNSVSVNFEINEGTPPKISAINFEGNKNFNAKTLRSQIISEKSIWYKFFSNNDLYITEKIELDKEMLKNFYWRHGFVDFDVKSVNSELAPDKKSLIITFFVREGERYNFGKTNFNIAIKTKEEDLRSLLQFNQGQIFNGDLLESTKYKISQFYKDRNILFLDIDYDFKINKKDQTVNVTFLVNKGKRIFINKINFIGNHRTADHVIRRELVFGEGDPYDETAIASSKRNLQNLAYFKSINFSNKFLPAPEWQDIDINLEEQSTGTLKFQAGYNTSLGPIGDISFSEYNFLGKGQNIDLNFSKAKKTSLIEFSFNEPRFKDRNLLIGYDIFISQLDKTQESSYSEKKKGGKLRMGYAINNFLYHKIIYTLRKENISTSAQANPFVKAQPNKSLLSSLGHSLIFDKLDNRIFPTSGYIFKFNQTIGGLGGNENYVKHDFEGRYFKQVLAKDVILSFIGRGGNIFGFGSKYVSISNSFHIGDEYIRGFDSDGIGPRYIANSSSASSSSGDALGGKNFLSSTVELQFPVGIPKEYGVKGAIFYDSAMLFGNDAYKYKAPAGTDPLSKNQMYDSKFVRMSYGVGILWDSPLGPIRLDYGIPFKKVNGIDVTQRLRFSLISNF